VLIIGAGPAGTAAARTLAQAGIDTVIVDQRPFPRDKVCGDGLISDALGALESLGLTRTVLDRAAYAEELRLYAPDGTCVPIAGRFACIPREQLDALLLDAATAAGAQFVPGATAERPLFDGGRVSGARLRLGGRDVDVTARLTLLSTGANATALEAFGLDVPMKPMAVAGRAYFEVSPEIAKRYWHLTIAYQREWCPGYGWIFPGPGNRFNLGVGLFTGRSDVSRLRQFWDFFCERFAPARDLLAAATQLTPFRGAPLRTNLTAAQFGRPGLLVIGEAAAVTYPATGEGIGKAMESALLAAGLAIDALAGRRSIDQLHIGYGGQFRRRFLDRYNAYDIGQSCAARPWLINVLARRANAGTFVRGELEALMAERGNAAALLSIRGLLTALVR
jgi:geranylgeranyl reductase family protein